MKAKRRYFHFINYFDVWGNKKEGYAVNNMRKEPFFIVTDFEDCPTMKSVLRCLKKADFIKEGARRESFTWMDFDLGYDLEAKRTQVPFGRFEETEEEDFLYSKEHSSDFVAYRQVYTKKARAINALYQQVKE